MKPHLQFELLTTIFLIVHVCSTITQLYCSSSCIDITGVCSDITYLDCDLCYFDIYEIIPNHNQVDPCILKPQRNIIFRQLLTEDMDLTGYASDSLTPNVCDNYTLSGQYTANSYLLKNFSNIPTNHYQLIIRFVVAYLGNWQNQNQMKINIAGTTYKWNYSCHAFQDLCSGSGFDCMAPKTFTVTHNDTNLFLNFGTQITQNDPTIKNWGIRDLLIVAKTCNNNCLTCYGPTSNQCLTCQSSFYLLGNTCTNTCPDYYSDNDRLCLKVCPINYFVNGNRCEKCQDGCSICQSINKCIVFSQQGSKQGSSSSGSSKQSQADIIGLWISIAILSGIVLVNLLWTIITKIKQSNNHQVVHSQTITTQKIETKKNITNLDQKEQKSVILQQIQEGSFVAIPQSVCVGRKMKKKKPNFRASSQRITAFNTGTIDSIFFEE